ncbi:MAG TPA: MFS transporter [Metalysinibacillus jejuensis]|uniref:MFS transporter n=1 Tax=Metalysinibacillus jejuensis TaxID=914327 RepID=A0A921T4F8_9BACL|nr:MFS transporter [Metalysinibacillus jejuensis]
MKRKTTPSQLLWLIAIFFVAVNLRPIITSIGPLFNVLLDELPSTNTKVSLLTSIPVFCMGLFAPLAFPLTRKFPTIIMPMLLAMIAIATILRAILPTYSILLLTSFIAGTAIAIIGPIMNARIKAQFKERTASALGVYSFGIGVGATLSASFSFAIYEQTSWSIALGSWGVLGIIAVVLWVAIAGEETLTQIAPQETARNPWRQKEAWLILLFFGLQTALFFSFMTWLSPLAVAQGFSLQEAGYLLMAFSAIQMLGNLAIPWLVERYFTPIIWLTFLSSLTLIGLLLFALTSGVWLWLGVLLIGLMLSGLFPLGLLLPLNAAKNDTEANTWSSMVLSGGFMLSAILPLLIGLVIDQTNQPSLAYVIFGSIIIIMQLIIWALSRTTKGFNS